MTTLTTDQEIVRLTNLLAEERLQNHNNMFRLENMTNLCTSFSNGRSHIASELNTIGYLLMPDNTIRKVL